MRRLGHLGGIKAFFWARRGVGRGAFAAPQPAAEAAVAPTAQLCVDEGLPLQVRAWRYAFPCALPMRLLHASNAAVVGPRAAAERLPSLFG